MIGVNKILTLNLSAYEMQQLEQDSQRAGMSVNQYAISRLFPQPPKQTIADMVEGKRLESFRGDPVAMQQEMRKDMLLSDFLKTLPKPTSYFKNAVELQREWRSEWDRTGDEKMLIEIPPQLESVIIMQAEQHGMTAQNYVLDQLRKITVKDDMLVTDFMAQIPPLDIFKDIDSVNYQREIRNEWN